jgi:hypothetical protein
LRGGGDWGNSQVRQTQSAVFQYQLASGV